MSNPELSSIWRFTRVLNINITTRLPLPHGLVCDIIPDRIFVAYMLRAFDLIETYSPFPRPDFRASKPYDLLLRFSHLHGATAFIPTSKLFTFPIDSHVLLFFVGKRVIY